MPSPEFPVRPGLPLKRVVVVLAGDPRTSPRAAEAARVADGLSHGEGLETALLIVGAAAAAFASPEREWVEGPLLYRHLVALARRNVPLYVEGEVPPGGPEALPLRRIDAAEAAALKRGAVVIEF